MAKYKEKPLSTIEAIQWNGKNFDEIMNFVEDFHGNKGAYEDAEEIACKTKKLNVETLDGPQKANINDYIVKGTYGQIHIYTPWYFNNRFEIDNSSNESEVVQFDEEDLIEIHNNWMQEGLARQDRLHKNKQSPKIAVRELISIESEINEFGDITEDWVKQEGSEFIYPFEYIQERIVSCDLEKGVMQKSLIFRKTKNGKFFKVQYSLHDYGQQNDMKDQLATEVFAEMRIVTIYT